MKHFGVEDYGPEEAARMMRKYKEVFKNTHHSCWNCQKTEMGGTKFPACSICRQKTHRYIRYCSKYADSIHICSCSTFLIDISIRECQRADWKEHRQICGKVIDPEIGVPKPAQIDDDELIPPPIPSFRRSPALLHQISDLKTFPAADYNVR